jgi:hypothetical protein
MAGRRTAPLATGAPEELGGRQPGLLRTGWIVALVFSSISGSAGGCKGGIDPSATISAMNGMKSESRTAATVISPPYRVSSGAASAVAVAAGSGAGSSER